jgi:hypothetical protein
MHAIADRIHCPPAETHPIGDGINAIARRVNAIDRRVNACDARSSRWAETLLR